MGYNIGPIDGQLMKGEASTRALQQFLKDQGIDPGPIDGNFGLLTICAWQRYLKFKA